MEPNLRVIMMPDYRAGNPYQTLLASGLEPLGVSVVFAKGYRRGLPIWRAVLEERPQVLHLHWLTPYLRGKNVLSQLLYAGKLWFDLCLVRMSGVNIVWTIHNLVSHEARFPRIERLVQNFVCRLACRVIVHSNSAQRSMIGALRNLDPAIVSVIPHGHYTEAYSALIPALEARQALGLAEDKTTFLYFGLVRPYKNVEGLIQAWKSLPEISTHATLLIAGDATDPAYHRHIAALASGVPGLKLQLTHVPDRLVHLYFSAADIVVLPFTRILTSGSLLLSLTYAKPVIAPRLETIVENLAGADDLVYDKDEEDGLRKTLQLAISQKVDLAGIRKRMESLCAGLNWDYIAGLTSCAYRTEVKSNNPNAL